MSLKIVIIESKIPGDKDTEYLQNHDLETNVVGSFDSLIDIIESAPPDVVDNFIADLQSKGWVNVKDIEKREDRIKALKQYFIISDGMYGHVESTNLSGINRFNQVQLERLASGQCFIVQKVSNECLTNEAKTIYDKAIKKYEKKKKENAKKQKERKVKAKERKIANAKKLLEEEGIGTK